MLTFQEPTFERYEIVLMRGLFGYVYFFYALPSRIQFRHQPHPIGIARLINLGFLGRPRVYRVLRYLAGIAVVFYAIDFAPLWPLLFLTLFYISVATLSASQGAINHGNHVVALVLVAQLMVYLLGPVLRGLAVWDMPGPDSEQLAVYWSQQSMMAIYFVSGLAKLARTKFLWVRDVSGLPASMISRAESAYQDRLKDPTSRDRARRWAESLAQRTLLSSLLFAGGLWVELLSPLALLNRATMVVGGGLLLLLHRLNGVVLHLPFRLNQYLLLIYFINVPYLIIQGLQYLALPDG